MVSKWRATARRVNAAHPASLFELCISVCASPALRDTLACTHTLTHVNLLPGVQGMNASEVNQLLGGLPGRDEE